jgi:thiamine biosynthesis protein ThiS
MKMKITINNEEEKEFEEGVNVTQILKDQDINPNLVAVAVNGDVIRKNEYDEPLSDGDKVDFLYMAAGG